MAFRLGLFPLNVVLFPGTPLPLHIFEPRYRRLLSDCLESDRRFGITLASNEREIPASGAVGCVAEVRSSDLLPDGRSNIIVLGRVRFTVRDVVADPAPYHVALVEEFDDLPDTTPPAELLRELREQFAGYYATLRQLHDAPPEELRLTEDPVPLTFAIAAAIECDAAIKQRLLATRSTLERARLLLQLLPTLTATTERALRVHRRAHTNGKGLHTLPPFDL
ncbi:MAG TPA: LON peptidase substrate-binding domain-containing protein [Gemmatimonadales bacterium]|nr:LON peptidase substrate-binding domain-containing protein [Gemmatimonadales bacterium]